MRTHRSDVKVLLDSYLTDRIGISVGNVFGYPAYKIFDRLFLIVGRKGIALLLPQSRVMQLIQDNHAYHKFEPLEGIIWNEWIHILRDAADAYQVDLRLVDAAIEFATTQHKRSS